MENLILQTFLRPATPKDIFTKEGLGSVLEEKQLFYKNKDGSIYGPYRLNSPFNELNNEYYLEIYNLLNDYRILIVDPLEYTESIKVDLPLKRVKEFDIMQGNHLIENTLFYLSSNNSLDGPFYINKNTTKKNLKNKVSNKLMFVLQKPALLNVIKSYNLIAS